MERHPKSLYLPLCPQSLSFSRKLKYHLVTKLFVVDYNQTCIHTF